MKYILKLKILGVRLASTVGGVSIADSLEGIAVEEARGREVSAVSRSSRWASNKQGKGPTQEIIDSGCVGGGTAASDAGRLGRALRARLVNERATSSPSDVPPSPTIKVKKGRE